MVEAADQKKVIQVLTCRKEEKKRVILITFQIDCKSSTFQWLSVRHTEKLRPF